jgi:hypothetical protein
MSEYLNFEEGKNNAWLTGVKFIRGTNEKPRNKIAMYLSAEPSSVSHTAPSTKQELYLPISSDQTSTKIAMERRIKAVLYPLAGFEPNQKTTLKDLFAAIEANLLSHDLQVELDIKQKEGNTADKDGNPRYFSEITSLTVAGYQDKVAFVSDVDYGDDDAPF